jgi:hypothetical protein
VGANSSVQLNINCRRTSANVSQGSHICCRGVEDREVCGGSSVYVSRLALWIQLLGLVRHMHVDSCVSLEVCKKRLNVSGLFPLVYESSSVAIQL